MPLSCFISEVLSDNFMNNCVGGVFSSKENEKLVVKKFLLSGRNFKWCTLKELFAELSLKN